MQPKKPELSVDEHRVVGVLSVEQSQAATVMHAWF